MKMPEGWNELDDQIAYVNIIRENRGSDTFNSCQFTLEYTINIRDLMQEMAEALEYTTKAVSPYDIDHSDRLVKHVLTKFKEWK